MKKDNNIIRILLVGSTPPPLHGSSIYLKSLIDALRNHGCFTVFHVNTSDGRDDLDNMGQLDLGNITSGLKAWWNVLRNCLRYRPQIIYVPIAQNTLAFLRDGLFLLTGRIFGAKALIHLHGSYFLDFYLNSNIIYRLFISFVIKNSSLALVLGDKLRPIFTRWLPEHRIKTLPNFISDDFLQYIESEKLNKKYHRNNNLKITYLGNLNETKGILQLIASVESLISQINIDLYLAGKYSTDPFTGTKKEQIKNEIENFRLKFPNNVFYLGPIYDLEIKCKYLLDADIFVFPSWYPIEGQPLVLLEAMAAGCPIISTLECGVIEDTVSNGVNGILVRKKNISQLSDAIRMLVENEQLRIQYGNASKRIFQERFTVDSHINKFHKICSSIVSTEEIVN